MIGMTMMMVGLVLMRPASAVLSVNPVPGDALREAYRAAAEAPVPADMRRLVRRIDVPLRLVRGNIR